MTHSRGTAVMIGSLGNVVEWYDWFVYSALSLYFAPAFFPTFSPTAQLLNAAAVFAAGFLMRPIGGWLMGIYADRYGRKTGLKAAVAIMTGGSALIALTPNYDTIGIAAPMILLLARLIQGLSLGGEYGMSASYLTEMAGTDRRGLYGSFQSVAVVGGQLLGLCVLIALQQVFLTETQLNAWGWRIPFAIGAAISAGAWLMLDKVAETEDFVAAQQEGRTRPSLRELARYPRQIMTVVGLTLGGTVAFYCYSTYMQKFLVNTAGFSKNSATLISSAALFASAFMQPALGALSDRIGRRALLITFGVSSTLATVPILSAVAVTKDPWAAFGLMCLGMLIASCYTAVSPVVKAELFPTEIRALGVGLPYAVSVSVFGGTAEFLGLLFKQMGHEPWFYWYVAASSAMSLVVYITMRDTKARWAQS